MLKRVTITVKPDMLKQIDGLVDGKDVRNRSHAIEKLIKRSLATAGISSVLVMAGGFSGLKPIAYELPKPMIPIAGRPVMEWQIRLLKKYGMENFVVSLGSMHEKTVSYFGDGSRFGVSIKYILEEQPLGTAGAIRLAKDYISSSFAMINVDTLVRPDVHAMWAFHRKQPTLATLLLASSPDPRKYGVVKMRGSEIVDFVEKPKKAASTITNAGFCIFEPQVMSIVPKGKFMIEELFRRLCAKRQLSGFVHDSEFYDIGTAEGYEAALKSWPNKF